MRSFIILLAAYTSLTLGRSDASTGSSEETAAAIIAGVFAEIAASSGADTSALPAAMVETTQPEQTGFATLFTAPASSTTTVAPATTYECEIRGPHLNYKGEKEHCDCNVNGTQKKCAQYSTEMDFASNVCTSCATDFNELLEAARTAAQSTNTAACAAEETLGPNLMEASELEKCGRGMLSTSDGVVYSYPGSGKATMELYEGLASKSLTTVTQPFGDPTPVSTIPPSITAASAYGARGDASQGAWVGPLTGGYLISNISAAFVEACGGDISPETPMTACTAEPIITGIPWPGPPGPLQTTPVVRDDGELHIEIRELALFDSLQRSRIALELGWLAAISIESAGVDNACKNIDTSKEQMFDRGHSMGTIESSIMGCVIPRDFVLREKGGPRVNGYDPMFWVTYSFTSEAGEVATPMCEGINNAVNGVLSFFMMVLSMLPVPGSAGAANAAGAVGNAAKAGATEARVLATQAGKKELAAKAIAAAEFVKIGCNTLEAIKEGDGLISTLATAFGEEEAAEAISDVFSGTDVENPYMQTSEQIMGSWDKLMRLKETAD